MLIGIPSEDFSQPAPVRFISYANAYLQSSRAICERMGKDSSDRTWPYAGVTKLLAAHAVELFLKGSILLRAASHLKKVNHDLSKLKKIYDENYTEPQFEWDFDGIDDYLGFREEEDIYPPSSIHNRYPVDKNGTDWPGIHFFSPEDFLTRISQMEKDFARIEEALKPLIAEQTSSKV